MEFNKKIAINNIKNRTDCSAWDKGVTQYALMLADNIPDDLTDMLKVTSAMLRGARNWVQYSYDGFAYVDNGDIAATLCSPSEFKRCKGRERNPNSRENWLDVQAKAICQAANRLFLAGLVEG